MGRDVTATLTGGGVFSLCGTLCDTSLFSFLFPLCGIAGVIPPVITYLIQCWSVPRTSSAAVRHKCFIKQYRQFSLARAVPDFLAFLMQISSCAELTKIPEPHTSSVWSCTKEYQKISNKRFHLPNVGFIFIACMTFILKITNGDPGA